MEAIILAIRLGLRRAWRGLLAFLERKRLTAMPPVRTVALLLAVGLIVPLAMGIDRTPASLSFSLAKQRLERLPRGGFPDTSPSDVTLCTEPAFFWKAHKKAARYRLRLLDGDMETHSTTVKKAHYLLPSPGELEPGRKYRFSVEAFDAEGKTLGFQVAYRPFTIVKPNAEFAKIRALATRELDPHQAAFVMAGVYTEHGSVHDVRSALARYFALAPAGDDTSLARSILGE